jgi:hypothetical protein
MTRPPLDLLLKLATTRAGPIATVDSTVTETDLTLSASLSVCIVVAEENPRESRSKPFHSFLYTRPRSTERHSLPPISLPFQFTLIYQPCSSPVSPSPPGRSPLPPSRRSVGPSLLRISESRAPPRYQALESSCRCGWLTGAVLTYVLVLLPLIKSLLPLVKSTFGLLWPTAARIRTSDPPSPFRPFY